MLQLWKTALFPARMTHRAVQLTPQICLQGIVDSFNQMDKDFTFWMVNKLELDKQHLKEVCIKTSTLTVEL